jgi:hypothetical protein
MDKKYIADKIKEITLEYHKNPEWGHDSEDELLWEVITSISEAGSSNSEGFYDLIGYCTELLKLNKLERQRWYS